MFNHKEHQGFHRGNRVLKFSRKEKIKKRKERKAYQTNLQNLQKHFLQYKKSLRALSKPLWALRKK